MPRYKADPREMTARFDSVCSETGKEIKKGETFVYYPNGKAAFHVDSKQAAEFYSLDFNAEW